MNPDLDIYYNYNILKNIKSKSFLENNSSINNNYKHNYNHNKTSNLHIIRF